MKTFERALASVLCAVVIATAATGQFKTMSDYGGNVFFNDNATPFANADSDFSGNGYAVYVPRGTWKTSRVPTGQYFGPGVVSVTGGSSAGTYPLAPVPSNLVAPITSGQSFILSNLTVGQGAGTSFSVGTSGTSADGSLAVGPYALNAAGNADRVTAVGYGCVRIAVNPTTADCLGSTALQFSDYVNRVVAVGANAGKWAGAHDPVATGHDFFDNNWGEIQTRNTLWPLNGPDGGWRSLVGPVGGPSMQMATSDNYNYENIYIGRDAGIHWVNGTRNSIVGAHADEGWLGNDNTCVGWSGLAIGTSTSGTTCLGSASFTDMMTDTDSIGIGSHVAPFLVHGMDLVAIGGNSLSVLDGSSKVKSVVNANVYADVLVGNNGGNSLHNVSRSVMIGTYFAQLAQTVTDSAGVGHGIWPDVTSVDQGVAIGYHAGTGNGAGLSNTIAVGANVGGLTASNSAKIGTGLSGGITLGGPTFASMTYRQRTNGVGIAYPAAQLLDAIIDRTGPSSSVTDTSPTAQDLVATLPAPEVGTAVVFYLHNSTSAATITLAPGAGVTSKFASTVAPGATRQFILLLTNVTNGSEAATLFGMAASN